MPVYMICFSCKIPLGRVTTHCDSPRLTIFCWVMQVSWNISCGVAYKCLGFCCNSQIYFLLTNHGFSTVTWGIQYKLQIRHQLFFLSMYPSKQMFYKLQCVALSVRLLVKCGTPRHISIILVSMKMSYGEYNFDPYVNSFQLGFLNLIVQMWW